MPRPTNNSRRTTLGAVNRRKSVDPNGNNNNRSPAPNKARSTRGRASMIPRMGRENAPPSSAFKSPRSTSKVTSATKSSSRKSVGGDRRQSLANPSAPARVDPRPISDKGFQQECIKQLLQFLIQSGYDLPISHKSLARPSGKDFSNIVSFMLRRVDPTFQDGTMKFEDEVAMNFKALGYPFPVSKTALVAAGSPHTWPALLAALHWLMERLQLLETATTENLNESGRFESLEELEQNSDKVFFKYLSEAYTAFLQGDEERSEQLESALSDRFERDDAVIEQEVEQMTDRNAAMVEKIHELNQESQDIEVYEKKKTDYETDLDQFHDLIRQMDEHVATLTQKKKERTQELDETNRKLARVSSSVEYLKKTVSEQEMSLEDVQKMQNEKKGVEEAIDRAVKLKEERLKASWETEAQVDKFWSELELAVSEYNAKLCELNLLPLVPAREVPMKIVTNKDAILDHDESKLLGVDFANVVRSNLLMLKQQYTNKFSDAKSTYQQVLDKVDQSEESLTMALERLKIIQEKAFKSDETLEKERDAQEAKLAVRQREVESMEAKVASLRDPVAVEEQLARYERELSELESLRIKRQEESIARKTTLREEVEQSYREMCEYEEFFELKVAEVENYWRDARASFKELKTPSQRIFVTEDCETRL